ncbi:MAG: Rrf2 family transcriptional regulator [Alphaproteobacteria bacterium]|nr:Rrf2 family transcriptional regulator [Alphaproteobacteria bacterium]
MRISTKGRHAVMAMVDLARNGQNGPVSLAEVAQRQEISLSYLEQLVARLKSAGLVKSIRGPGGGYRLAEPSENISAYQIVRAVDDTSSRVYVEDPSNVRDRQLTDLLWQSISDEVNAYLKTITLEDVATCTLCQSDANKLGDLTDEAPVIQLPDHTSESLSHAV